MMREVIEALIKELAKEVKKEIISGKEYAAKLALNAYNRYSEDECDGNYYIFDINNSEDLACCVKGGLTAIEIAEMVDNEWKYFLFGHDHTEPTRCHPMELILPMLEEVCRYVICYPEVGEYKELYDRFISQKIYN